MSLVLRFEFIMKVIVLLVCFCAAALADEGVEADICREAQCLIENNCRCASTRSPFENPQDGPQLISLTFDEAVTDDLFVNYWEPLLFSRMNPDGQPIGATFFVPHEYTNYQRVNDLYNYGFEIGVHSITNDPLQSYWRDATEKLLEQEFNGQKEIISRFANIPAEDITGVRTPQLQLAENFTIQAYVRSGFVYDSSWPTQPDHPLFPYTLDYLSTQQCNLGSKCPNEAFPGFWVLPIVDLNGDGKVCDTLTSCDIHGSADDIADWLYKEIDQIRSGTRVPITLLVTSNWFNGTENAWQGFNLALDRIAEHQDVFLVAQNQVLEWIKNPVSTAAFQTDVPMRNANCNPYVCRMTKVGQGGDDNADKQRYMNACIPCPAAYPWLGNTDGHNE